MTTDPGLTHQLVRQTQPPQARQPLCRSASLRDSPPTTQFLLPLLDLPLAGLQRSDSPSQVLLLPEMQRRQSHLRTSPPPAINLPPAPHPELILPVPPCPPPAPVAMCLLGAAASRLVVAAAALGHQDPVATCPAHQSRQPSPLQDRATYLPAHEPRRHQHPGNLPHSRPNRSTRRLALPHCTRAHRDPPWRRT